MHFNIQGLFKKLCDLELLLDTYNTDLCCFSEHWLTKNEINMANLRKYSLVSSFCRENYERGGVCIYAKTGITCKPINFDHSLEKIFEVAMSEVRAPNFSSKILIISIYRSPQSDFKTFFNYLYDLMSNVYVPGQYYIVCGDINVNLLGDNYESKQIINMFKGFDMENVVLEPTRLTTVTATLIDVIFTNLECGNILVQDTHMSDHTFQLGEFVVPLVSNTTLSSNGNVIFKRDFSDCNMLTFQNMILNERWENMYQEIDLNNIFNNFYYTFLYHFQQAFPLKKVRPLKTRKWFSDDLKNLHQMLIQLAKISRLSENQVIRNRYNQLKTIYTNKIRQVRYSYNNERILKAKNAVKECWNIIKETKGSSTGNIPEEITTPDGTMVKGYGNIVNSFNNHFMDFVCPQPNYDEINLSPYVPLTFYLTPTTPTEIETLIMRTTMKSASGTDDIGGNVLRAVSKIISVPLSYIINKSFLSGQYPNILKLSKCIPIFKNKGSRNDICNYRNVCIQSQIAKVIEMSYNTRLTNFLETNKLLSLSQHGFRSNKSTSTAIADLNTIIYEALNNKQQSVALFFDLTRAFDSVNHDLLLEKLSRIGVRGVANDWVKSYLTNRQQIVTLGNYKSDIREITVGVPQGSILGPLLYIIFVNDLSLSCSSIDNKILYADDTNFVLSGENLNSVCNKANDACKNFHQYCINSGLLINTNKSVLMTFNPKNDKRDFSLLITLDHRSIEHVQYIKFLGILIDEKMTWKHHIDMVVSRLSSVCFLIRQLKNTVSFEVLRLVYFGLAQSTLSYGLIFWGCSAHLEKAFMVQKCIVRCLVGVPITTSCKPIFRELSILTLPSLYIYLLILNVKDKETLIKNNSVHEHDTRGKNDIYQPFSRLSVGKNSHLYQGTMCYNKFTRLVGDDENKFKFKTKLYDYLVDKTFYSVKEFLEL